MSDHAEKSFDMHKQRLNDLYCQVDEAIKSDVNPAELKTIMFAANHAFSEMERIMLQESDALNFADNLDVIQSQQTLKSKFDSRVTKWLEGKGLTPKSINEILGLSRTLRPRGTKSVSSSRRSVSHSVKSNASSKASSRVKVETARLRLKQLEEKHELEKQEAALKQKRLQEENALKHKFEMLQASQQLEEAVLERQVMEEELERAGYITPEEILDSSSESEQVVRDLFLSKTDQTDVAATVLGVTPTSNLGILDLKSDNPSISGFRQSVEPNKTLPKLTKVFEAKKTVTQPLPLVGNNEPVKTREVTQINRFIDDPLPQAQGSVNDPHHFAPMEVQKQSIPAVIPHPGVKDKIQTQVNSFIPTESSPQNRTNDETTSAQPEQSNDNLVQAFTRALHANVNKPNLELFKFCGEATTYTRFITTFEATIEVNERDYRLKLIYLLQHCEGKAKSLIQHCVLLDPEIGYAKAKQLLYENFGRKPLIARAYIKNLVEGHFIKYDDSNALVRFAHDIEECYTTLGHMKYYSDLNCFENISKVAKRLPSSLLNRWFRVVADIEVQNREPTFYDLMEFVKKEARVVSSCYASASNWKPSKNSAKFAPKVNTHSTAVSRNYEKCSFCSGKHAIWDCSVFARKGLNARLQFMRQNHLCDNCGKQGHISKFCYGKSRCTKSNCTLKHHTLLHRDSSFSTNRSRTQYPRTSSKDVGTSTNEDSGSATVSGFSTTVPSSDSVYLNVIPVKVSARNKSILTYAFLDQGSTATLCDERLLDQLDISGEKLDFKITTINGKSTCHRGSKVSLTLSSLVGPETLTLPEVLSIDCLPANPNPPLSRNDLKIWPHLQGVDLPQINGSVTILIGVDVPEAFWVVEERRGSSSDPYAVRSKLGWAVVGRKYSDSFVTDVGVNFVNTVGARQALDQQIERLWTIDNVPKRNIPLSKEDRYALQVMENSKKFENGHYEIALPWRPGSPQLQDNRAQALSRLASLKRRFDKNPELKVKYVSVVESYIANGHAEVTNSNESGLDGWYLPHHPVFHPRKPNKVRVVFDCAARFGGTSLNDQLLRGPDFLNSLIEVLIKFRSDKVAVVADIEQMFHQCRVSPKDRKYLRFLWWPQGNVILQPITYHMKVHIFGATSSPSCAQFCLLQSVNDQPEICEKVKALVQNNFYMDDCLFSAPTVREAVFLAQQVTAAMKNGGFNLTKWVSNNSEVLAALPTDKLSNSVLSFSGSNEVCERVLGLEWDVCNDHFKFQVCPKNKPPTRRGMLSILSSVFDPLGYAAPVILVAKLLFQELCRLKCNWDEAMADNILYLWQSWLSDLNYLPEVRIPRCLNVSDTSYSQAVCCELHHFADASSKGYGTVSFLRVVNADGLAFCNFVIGKAKLAPLKTVSIPRLELMAATLAVQLDQMLQPNLNINLTSTVFWTDSLSVLFMINNTCKKFPVFVANRLSKIEEGSNSKQWRYVESKSNPADDASRGLSAKELSSRWLRGPEFLWESEENWPKAPVSFPELPSEFSILKSKTIAAHQVALSSCSYEFDKRFARCSSWSRLCKAVAWIMRWQARVRTKRTTDGLLTVEELQSAEKAIVARVQHDVYFSEISYLNQFSEEVSAKREFKTSLLRLKPIFSAGLLRVGGRLRRSSEEFDIKHPVILPPDAHVTRLIVEDFHVRMGHSGMAHTWTSIRQRYWIIKGAAAVRKILGKCLFCSRRNARLGQQLMADLPEGRVLSSNPLFFHAGVDYFGPILVRQGRCTVKRYGCVFTCLATRAVHLEIGYSLATDAFINALRRFVSRRGCPHTIFSDNGTNFVGAQRELRQALQELNQFKIFKEMRSRGIRWIFQCPQASHMGEFTRELFGPSSVFYLP